MKRFIWGSCLVLSVGGPLLALAVAQDTKRESGAVAKTAKPDEVVEQMKADATTEIKKAVTAYIAAFNARDATTLAELWSPGAVYRSQATGEIIAGREALEAEFAAQFEDRKDARLEVATKSIEFISPNVALEEGTATIVQTNMPPEKSSYTVIYVKRDDKWLIDRVKEEQGSAAQDAHYEQLKDLEWLVGTWVDQDGDTVITTECQWVGNRNFLLRSFTVSSGAESADVSGMQFVGWDAGKKQIRSWVFDSDGGFAEGVWTKKKDRWIVKTKATLAGGEIATSTSVLKPVDGDSFTWQKVNRFIDGEILPNISEVLLVRE